MFTVVLCIFVVVVQMFALHFSRYLLPFHCSILFLFHLYCIRRDQAPRGLPRPLPAAFGIYSIRSLRCTVMCIATFIFTTKFLYARVAARNAGDQCKLVL